MRHLPAYLQLVGMGVQMIAAYRVNAVLGTVSMLLQVYLLRVVWEAVYAGQPQVEGVPLPVALAYLTIATVQSWLLSPSLAWFLAERVRDGSVATELARPAPFLGRLLAQQAGDTAFSLPFAALSLPFAVLLGGMQPPASAGHAALYVLSVALAYGNMVVISLLIGLASFWTIEIYAFVMINRFVGAFLGGAMIPLWFFPPLLRSLAEWLPFHAQVFVPVAIYLGQLNGGDLARALAVQVFWLVALYLGAHALWRHAMRRVVVQGG